MQKCRKLVFNDEYREVIKGGSSDNVLVNKGFITGNLYETEKARNVITATNRYTSPDQSINYVECHDNATVFDKLYISNVEEGLDGIITRQKNLTITVLLSQEFPLSMRDKNFIELKAGLGILIIHLIILTVLIGIFEIFIKMILMR